MSDTSVLTEITVVKLQTRCICDLLWRLI